jgi:hypothetical protein
MNHFIERVKIYSEEKFDYKIHEIDLWSKELTQYLN